MKIGIDLDGVLGIFSDRVVTIANKLWPGKLPPDYIPTNWDYTDVFSKADWDAVWAEIKLTEDFWRDEKPYEENVTALGDFMVRRSFQDDFYFVTSRTVTVGESPLVQTSRWLKEQGLWPRRGHSVVIPVEDPKLKASVIQALKIPYMLDDYAPTVEHLNSLEGFKPKAFVLDRLWNQHAAHLPRVFSMGEYLKVIESLETV